MPRSRVETLRVSDKLVKAVFQGREEFVSFDATRRPQRAHSGLASASFVRLKTLWKACTWD
jgi:hypothetical protein